MSTLRRYARLRPTVLVPDPRLGQRPPPKPLMWLQPPRTRRFFIGPRMFAWRCCLRTGTIIYIAFSSANLNDESPIPAVATGPLFVAADDRLTKARVNRMQAWVTLGAFSLAGAGVLCRRITLL